jgi:hypothetical protein
MEFIFELLFELFGELLLQLALELLAELGLRAVGRPFAKPLHPLAGGVGYALLGAIAGGLSLWWFPQLFIASHAGRIANVIVTPLLSGGAMAMLGAWRRRHDQRTVLIDRFAYAFIFAMAMALIRLRFGTA